jgi:hypothetical protein
MSRDSFVRLKVHPGARDRKMFIEIMEAKLNPGEVAAMSVATMKAIDRGISCATVPPGQDTFLGLKRQLDESVPFGEVKVVVPAGCDTCAIERIVCQNEEECADHCVDWQPRANPQMAVGHVLSVPDEESEAALEAERVEDKYELPVVDELEDL